MNVVGYVRVSSARQAENGFGLEAQRTAISLAAQARGWDVEFYEDAAVSGRALTNRPGLQSALAALAKPTGGVLVVAKLDRVSRSMLDFAKLLETARRQGWALVALDIGVDTTTVTGELVANVLMSVAQWERRMGGARTKAALAEARARGVPIGGPRRTPPEVDRQIIRLHNMGKNPSEIARALERDQVPTPNGGAFWRPWTVTRILRSRAA